MGKAVPELSGLDGASHSAMENKNNYGMPETARVGHTEKDLMGSLGCSGSIRIKYKSEVKIQWKKNKKAPALFLSCPLVIHTCSATLGHPVLRERCHCLSPPSKTIDPAPKKHREQSRSSPGTQMCRVAAIPCRKEWEHISPSHGPALAQRKPLWVAVHIFFCMQTYRNIYKIYLALSSTLLPT